MLVRRDRAMVAVLIMLDVGFHAGRGSTVSAAEIAERAGLARRGIEPLLQALSRSGLLESVRGPRGELQDAVVDKLWHELDASLCERLQTMTLDDLLRRAEAAGLRRPLAEPISFSI